MIENIVNESSNDSYMSEPIDMFRPDYETAYKAMQDDLEAKLSELGEVKKTQTQNDFFGEQNHFEYEVYDKQGNLIAKVTYKMANHDDEGNPLPVVEINAEEGYENDLLIKDMEKYFIDDFEENYERYRKKWNEDNDTGWESKLDSLTD